jgi:hypothetical protein
VTITVSNPRGKTSGTLTIVAGENGQTLALTPPLGWNSWNAWGNTGHGGAGEGVSRREWSRAVCIGRATPTSTSTTSGKAD